MEFSEILSKSNYPRQKIMT